MGLYVSISRKRDFKEDPILRLKYEILKDVFITLSEEEEAEALKLMKKDEEQDILDELERRKKEDLRSLSKEDLIKRLEGNNRY